MHVRRTDARRDVVRWTPPGGLANLSTFRHASRAESMPTLRYVIKHSNHPAARFARRAVIGTREFTLPVPRPIVVPIVKGFLALRSLYYWVWRVFFCEPFFKAQCASYGEKVRTGTFLHFITGAGDIVLGDRVRVEGKIAVIFASVLPERPVLEIGDDSYVNHLCSFSVARRVTIGRHVYLASRVTIMDSPGHPMDAELRAAGHAPPAEDVKPVVIEDKVWIGTGVSILPGVTIGEGSVIGIDSVVTKDVPPYTLAAGVPARPIRSLRTVPANGDAPVESAAAAAVLG
jgi:acetyltransferase-like isoleucine patch superfamily enzyme